MFKMCRFHNCSVYTIALFEMVMPLSFESLPYIIMGESKHAKLT